MLRFTLPAECSMDLEDLRRALIASITARQRQKPLLLCFDDIEQTHCHDISDEEQRLLLEKFALTPDHTLHYHDQLRRAQQLAVRLVEEKKAFLCTCDPERLRKEREEAEQAGRPYRYSGRCAQMNPEEIRQIRAEGVPFTIRLRKPSEAIRFDDHCAGEVCFEPEAIDHFVILHADGTPTETFAAACCDMFSGVKTALTGVDELLHTARMIHIHRSLGYDAEIRYAHLPPLLDDEGRSIRHHHERYNLKILLEAGYLPDAIINALLSLGTNPPEEIFTLPKALEWFELSRLSCEALPFDPQRLEAINREHLRRMDDRDLSRLFGFADAEIGRAAKLYLDEASTIEELRRKIQALFRPKSCDETMRRLSRLVIEGPAFTRYEDLRVYLSERSGIDPESVDALMGRLMSGNSDGPAPSRLYPHLKSYITEVVRCQP